MLCAINTSVLKKETAKFLTAESICLHIDESTNKKNLNFLLVYLTLSSKDSAANGEHFGAILHLDSGLDALPIAEEVDRWLRNAGIPKEKIVLFTSDGASVMLGRLGGVAQRLRAEFVTF